MLLLWSEIWHDSALRAASISLDSQQQCRLVFAERLHIRKSSQRKGVFHLVYASLAAAAA